MPSPEAIGIWDPAAICSIWDSGQSWSIPGVRFAHRPNSSRGLCYRLRSASSSAIERDFISTQAKLISPFSRLSNNHHGEPRPAQPALLETLHARKISDNWSPPPPVGIVHDLFLTNIASKAAVSTEMSEEDGGLSGPDWPGQAGAVTPEGSDSEHDVPVNGADGSSQPIQKRRRVTRACDECRRKKIKCDGKQPCTHCSVYSYGRFLNISSSQLSLRTDGRVLTILCRMYLRQTFQPQAQSRSSVHRSPRRPTATRRVTATQVHA